MSEVKVWCDGCTAVGINNIPQENPGLCPDCEGKGYTVQTLYTKEEMAKAWDEGRDAEREAVKSGYISYLSAIENPYREDDDES